MKVGIIGLGLIGGSVGLSLKSKGYEILGWDHSSQHCEQALDIGIIDRIISYEDIVKAADIIFLAIPVDMIEQLLPSLLTDINWKTTVVDLGSTKQAICVAVADHPKRGRYVAAHPLAGTEFSGPMAAIEGLYQGKKCILCEEHKSDEDAVDATMKLLGEMGLNILLMNPEDHDKHMAYVSHLSHVSSFMLSLTVLDIEEDEKQILNLASTGFESTARLAKSSPETWASIFDKNSEHLSTALGSYIAYLTEFKEVIDSKDTAKAKTMMKRANEIKRVLKGLRLNAVKLS